MKIYLRFFSILALLLGLALPSLRAEAPASLHFLVLSDWGRESINDKEKKTPGQLKVAKVLARSAKDSQASFLMTCGDNFHGKGVPAPNDPLWAVNVEQVYGDPALQIPWYVTLGNHDYEGNVEAELAYAKTHPNWIQPARYYSFTKTLADGTTALFMVLDSSPMVQQYEDDSADRHHVHGQDPAAQTRWIEATLKASKAAWKLVFFHHPAYSASSTHGSTVELQKVWVPLFEQYHVDACFSGHDHDLQHSHPAGATVEYFGVGGGSETRPVGHEPFTKFSRSSLGFGVASLSPKLLTFTFINDQGEAIYKQRIAK
jgi:predicted phosphohydrolase